MISDDEKLLLEAVGAFCNLRANQLADFCTMMLKEGIYVNVSVFVDVHGPHLFGGPMEEK